MRPHVLELEAFGAFPHHVRLDLDELATGGLVLLAGETGGGKTTLLDALAFALYGRVPGERHKAKEDLRSHHAEAGAAPWVRLELTARGRRLRVTRSPEWHRPKQRGSGTAKVQATALLEERVAGAWRPLAQRPDDVGHEVGRLLGMSASQFFQVVVLPQGRFADFLQAKSDERAQLLRQLFHVDRYETAERLLADRAAAAGRALEAQLHALDTVVARVAQAAGTEPPGDAEDVSWSAALAADAAEEARQAQAEEEQRRRARAEAERARAEAEHLRRRQSARREAQQRLDALLADDARVSALDEERLAALRAVPVRVAHVDAASLGTLAATAEAGRDAALDALVLLDGAAGDLDALRRRASAARAEWGRLAALVELSDRAARCRLDAGAARAAAASLETALHRVAVEREQELPAARAAAGARLAAAREAQDRLPEARAALDAARAAEQGRAAAAAAEAAAARAEAAADDARRAATRLSERARELREQRVDAIAAELARLLVEGAPCPVCGALEHPEVAEVRAEHVDRAAEQAADAAAREADAAAARAATEHARLRERADLLREAAGEPGDAATADARVTALERAAAALPGAEAELQACAARELTAAAESARLEAQLAEQQRRAEELDAEADAAAQRLGDELGPGADVAAHRRHVQAVAEAAERAAAAAGEALAARAAHERALRAVAEQVAAAGFPGVDAALAAVRADAWCADAASQVQRHRQEVERLRGLLEGEELAVDPDAPAPVEELLAAEADAVGAHEQAVATARVTADRAAALAELAPRHADAVRALGPARADLAELRGLAELCAGRGQNRLSMSLSTYVLAARLEEVAEAATLRLRRMSGGRYALVHTDEGKDRRSRAGLGLQVEDAWTGRRRDTATLSGGETFLAALALALGLADVVTAEAGGATIDALFVDEGFGSLDPTTLDQVMDVLDDLRAGGRLVGVVSHVAELKQRIPTQVAVLKSTSGSRVEVRTAVVA